MTDTIDGNPITRVEGSGSNLIEETPWMFTGYPGVRQRMTRVGGCYTFNEYSDRASGRGWSFQTGIGRDPTGPDVYQRFRDARYSEAIRLRDERGLPRPNRGEALLKARTAREFHEAALTKARDEELAR